MTKGQFDSPNDNGGIKSLLIANRGEIAVRIARTAAEMGIVTTAIYSQDDQTSLHVKRANKAIELPGNGARAYLDMDAVIQAAISCGAEAIHPGYGFLSENPNFARQVEKAGLIFIGPSPQSLTLLADKIAAKNLADKMGIPTLPGTTSATSLKEAQAFFDNLPDEEVTVLIKAVAGGGGRGMKIVTARKDLPSAWERCRSEAEAAFGCPDVYVERFLPKARHLEVQIVGDGTGRCIHFGERECTLQRRHQKVVEMAPSPTLSALERETITSYAVKLAESQSYRSLGTFEFLLDVNAKGSENLFFIEANPRIQVEHTVTEEVFDCDLVRLQLEIAAGNTLSGLGINQQNLPSPRGYSLQLRVNMERMDINGNTLPTSGKIEVYEPPTGAGIRVDGFAYAGYRSSSSFDSLLAKLVVHSNLPGFDSVLRKAARALEEFRILGLETNLQWLQALINRPEVLENKVTTRFIEQHAAELASSAQELLPPLFFEEDTSAGEKRQEVTELLPGTEGVSAPMQSTVISLFVKEGDVVKAGEQLAVLEAMKMEHVICSPCNGMIRAILTETGKTLMEGEPVFAIEPGASSEGQVDISDMIDLDTIRKDLDDVRERRAYGLDENRPEAVEKRHGRGHQTARENLAQLCDAGTFLEYGEFAIAAQRQRRSLDDLTRNTSGDSVITGLGSINGDKFSEDKARCAFAINDYMVLAGTQGQRHHRKLDRIFSLAGDQNLPLIMLAEGGGGRPGDTERMTYAGISNGTFTKLANLSGQVPLVGVVSGRCFAGNAALLGCCDVIIADESTNLGMAGPAMIEGGGLGIYEPESIGPIDIQSQNGVVDIRVKDEAEACKVAKQYISYFQGAVSDWSEPDQRVLRHTIPENRLRVYEVKQIIEAMADEGSVLELRREFGVGIVTTFIRIEGKPFGVIANNSQHLGGAIDAPAADKASRFMQLCDAFDIPIVSLCDTPGFMVGPEAEKTALVRHVCRMFVTARSISVPLFGIVLRKCYGLGAQAMLAGGAYDDFFTVSWPTGEFGPMGLEGAVKLGFKRELDALTDPVDKQALYNKLLAEYYEQGKAISVASTLEIDAVIDPVETRCWILGGLRSASLRPPLSGRKRSFVDTW
ncbi:carboxyl transferase domain-containing protein [uncultured Sneathiella sp.]|jgi:acetyl/propionyl-CoA carboxylase alpha subunit/acetyl-CoA carboxylase carboxyltransferase component|uniref:carboxyl transferase domain-containing protein n=2 Tax=uncultured Sneathiella sp. TaxID=879315 RepID=UPI0030D9C59B|tara:strand:- start:47871 stop:51212 length:3342 start_codon:yes stop_codon:yes gene_type:complete